MYQDKKAPEVSARFACDRAIAIAVCAAEVHAPVQDTIMEGTCAADSQAH
jgi:hypothetical protein